MHKWFDSIKELFFYYVLLLLVSAGLFALAEHKDYFTAFWWACVTSTSTGYGDVYPVTVLGRLVAIALMHISLFLVFPLTVYHVCSGLIKNQHEFTDQEQEDIKAQLKSINEKLDGRW